MLGKKKMMAYSFVDDNKQQALYWRDVGTLDAYYDANMDPCSVSPTFNLYDKNWPIRTRVRQYPPAKFVFGEPGRSGMAVNSVITAGVIISGATVSNCVVSQDVRVNSYSNVDASIIFSHVNIGRHCRIRRAIIDRDVHIPEGTVIGYDPVEDKRRYFVTPTGLTIVTRDASLFESRRSAVFEAALICRLCESIIATGRVWAWTPTRQPVWRPALRSGKYKPKRPQRQEGPQCEGSASGSAPGCFGVWG